MAYRGDGEASPERLAALDADIAAREGRLSAIFWERVAPVWGVPRGLSAALSPLEARHARVAELDAAIERARRGPAAEPALPPLPPPSEGVLASIDQALSFMPPDVLAGVVEAARAHAPDAELVYRGAGRWSARLDVEGAPVELRLTRERNGDQSYFVVSAETTVAPAAHLSLRPEGILQDLLEMLGVRKEIELDDPAFDPIFVITGDEATAERYLSRTVRKAILVVNEELGSSFTIAGGRAVGRCGSPSRRAVSRLLEVVAAWHAMPSPHPLLVDRDDP